MKAFILSLLMIIGVYAAPDELFYRVAQTSDKEVEVTFNYCPKNGRDSLYVPDSVQLLSHRKNGRCIKVEGNQIEVKYKIQGKKNWKCGEGYQPKIEKGFFHLEGENLFVHPNRFRDEPINMHIDWEEDKTIVNSFGVKECSQHFTTSLFDLKRSIFIGGNNLNISTQKIMGQDVSFLFKTKKRDIESMKNNIASIIEVQRRMYNQNDFHHYFVAVLDDIGRGGGRAFVNGCCLYLSDKSGIDMSWVFSHEHFHNFNGIRVHAQDSTEDLSWFIEGFSEFYANRINHRSGIYDEATYKKNIQKCFEEYKRFQARKLSYPKIIANKNTESFYKRYLYVKGHLFAHYLDGEIKAASNNRKSLDDFMVDIYKSHYQKDNSLTLDKLERIYARYDNKKLSEHVLEFMHSDRLLIEQKKAIISRIA